MKARGVPLGKLVHWVVLALLFLCVAATARADIQSPWITVRPGAVLAVATTAGDVPGAPKVVFIGTTTGVLKSADGGLSWAQVLSGSTSSLASDPSLPGVVYAATAAGLQRTADRGQTWAVLSTAVKTGLAVSPFDSQVIFYGPTRSLDGGATWAAMAGLPVYGSSYAHIKTTSDPANPGTLLSFSGSGVYRTVDNGASWTPVNVGFTEDSTELDSVDARYFYVGACGGSIYRAYPGGSATSGNIGGHVHGIVVDPGAHNRVYAARDSGGVSVSTDFGATWNAPGGGSTPGGVKEGRMLFDADSGIIYLPTSSGLVLKNSRCTDADHDGASPEGGLCGAVDCDDASAARSPFKKENCFDGIDNSCTGFVDFADSWCVANCVDADGDGHFVTLCGGDDPKDADATVFPGAPELCDDKDNDLDLTIDEGCTRYTYYRDYDGDGFGNPTGTFVSSFTTPPPGFLTDSQDCYDWDATIHPGALDVCGDGWDNDCDGTADNGCPTYTYYVDGDSDGYGDPSQPLVSTIAAPWVGVSVNPLDCNDVAGWINPGVVEECDWLDNNCDDAIDEGCGHTAMLFGSNGKGQLGDGTTTDRKSPVALGTLSPVAVAAGDQHTLAVNNDGHVYAWGANGSGQLGDGTTTTRKTPVQVPGLTGVVALAAGLNHSLALKADGTVWAWGGNGYGQLGDGTTTTRKTPVQVSGLAGVAAISAGNYHNLALLRDGTVWAWGNNGAGRLGDGTGITRKTPVLVTDPLLGFEYAIAVAAGGDFSLALDWNGSVWAWGENCSGQLGDGTTTVRKKPTMIPALANMIWGIAAGSAHGLAMTGDGIMAWGANAKGQLGDGTTTTRKAPVLIAETSGVQTIAAGGAHSLALVWSADTLELLAWGSNAAGQLGDGTTTTRKSPVIVPGQGDALFLATGGAHSITLR